MSMDSTAPATILDRIRSAACLITPFLFFAVLALAFPLGYRIVLGDPDSPTAEGHVERVTFEDGSQLSDAMGEPAEIRRGFLVIRPGTPEETWIPKEALREVRLMRD